MGAPKERRYVRVAGVSPDVDVVPFTHDLNTLLRAVTERVFLVKGESGFCSPPRPGPNVFSRRLSEVRGMLSKILPKTAPVTHQQFVDGYRGRRRERYQAALDELRAGRGSLEGDAKVKVFVKYEKTDRTTKADPVPRVISPRHPRFNIRVGRYLARLEKRLLHSLDRLFHPSIPTVIKGMNAEQSAKVLRDKWELFHDPVAVGLDASRFDQHVSIDALRWEHQVYLACFPERKHRDRLARLLKFQEINECSGDTPDGTVNYTITGTRMSGDMNTSLGNCLLMCSMFKAYLLHLNIDAQLINNGDDCVAFMERRDLGAFMCEVKSWFLKLGFNMSVEAPVDVFEQIEFCQTHPIFDGVDWVMCRNPHTALAKDAVMLKCWDTSSVWRGWLDAVGTGGIALTGGLPVFQSFYSSYVRSGLKRPIPEELLPWSFRNMGMGMRRVRGLVRPEARASFWAAYDIVPDEQIELEKYYDALSISHVPGPFVARGIF